MQTIEIIIVEDSDTMRLGMVETLKREGHHIQEFDNAKSALSAFLKKPVPVVITDLKMSKMDGLELLQEIKNHHPTTEVLLVSAHGTLEVAVQAMQAGASDFLTKPFSPDELRFRIKKLIEKIQKDVEIDTLKSQNILLSEELFTSKSTMIGESASIKNILSLIDRVSVQDTTVLIQGESGTGKELVAREIHERSHRSGKPFIKVNCAAFNENLLESELFGHEKGSFTGASARKRGRFELANNGTLFLDEIGDVSPATQVKLLRVLQEREIERVGGETTIPVNVRMITATNRNLQKMIADGSFRADLFYRLNVFPIQLPTLKERKDDIPLLIHHFLEKTALKFSDSVKTISSAGIGLLQTYSWPGNIRELENVIERLHLISPETEILTSQIVSVLGISSSEEVFIKQNMSLEESVFDYEKNLIVRAMDSSNGIKNQAAKILGINTSTLYYKLEKFGLIDKYGK